MTSDDANIGLNRISRREALKRGGFAAFSFVAASSSLTRSAASPRTPQGTWRRERSPDIVGQWDAPFDVGVIAVHAVVLSSGKILFFSYPDFSVGSNGKLFNPADSTIQDVSLSTNRDIFCAGYSALPDGRVFVTGGDHYGFPQVGSRKTNFFDPVSETWSAGPTMVAPRWYPSNVAMPDGRVLIVGGGKTNSRLVSSVERYDPASDSLETLPRSAWGAFGMYPGLHVLPNGRVFLADEEAPSFDEWTAEFHPATNSWKRLSPLVDGPRFQSPSLLLPDGKTVMVAGGTEAKTGGGPGAKKTVELFDTSMSPGRWKLTASMNFARRNLNTVILADGSVMAVGGNQNGLYTDPVLASELFDPVTKSWTIAAAQQASRGHHSVAVLMPDGRVISAGQTNGPLQYFAEIYSPPYLFKGARPSIAAAPSSASYAGPMTISSPDAAAVQRVALVRPGATTHACNFEQRYVDLTFTKSPGQIDAAAPSNGNLAPPGWYMLFIVDGAGIPSVASWVQLT